VRRACSVIIMEMELKYIHLNYIYINKQHPRVVHTAVLCPETKRQGMETHLSIYWPYCFCVIWPALPTNAQLRMLLRAHPPAHGAM
jgi:hypothetical protein